jgi:hypothetical protein
MTPHISFCPSILWHKQHILLAFWEVSSQTPPEVVEHPEEVQPEIEQYPEEVQPEIMVEEHQEVQPQEEIEEEPEEVLFEDDEEPEEQPQLYDGVLLKVDTDRDMMIPPAADDARPTPLADPTDDDAPIPDAADDDVPVPDAAEDEPDDILRMILVVMRMTPVVVRMKMVMMRKMKM